MPLFEQFPYTNFHDLNLDQIAKKIGELETLTQSIKEMKILAANLQKQMDKINEKINEVEQLYATFVANIERRFNNLETSLMDDLNIFKAGIQTQINDFQGEIDALDDRLTDVLDNLPNEIIMTSPITGEQTNLINIINQLAGASKTESLTASEYDALALTASAYDAHNLTAYDYDWKGKTLLS